MNRVHGLALLVHVHVRVDEKRLAMAEVGVTMHPWEYRARFYGEAEDVARERAEGLGIKPSRGVGA